MVAGQFFSTFLACIAYTIFTRAHCAYIDAGQKLYNDLQNLPYNPIDGYLQLALAAAGSGKNFFNVPQKLSEDCVRTAKVSMELYARLSTVDSMAFEIGRSVQTAVTKLKSIQAFRNPVELVCENINEQLKNSPYAADFESRKKLVTLPTPSKNYIFDIPEKDIEHAMKGGFKNIDDIEVIKFLNIISFMNTDDDEYDDKNRRPIHASANAIKSLSRRDALKSAVDSLFAKTLEDHSKIVLAVVQEENRKDKEDVVETLLSTAFEKVLDENFSKDSTLKDEYVIAKNKIISKINIMDTSESTPKA